MKPGEQIIELALENGATVAGIAGVEALRASASHVIYTRLGDYRGVGTYKKGADAAQELFRWPDSAKSLLVIGLAHPKERLELDWWDGRGTPGNRMLIDIVGWTRRQIEARLNIQTHTAHYYVEKGGVFLKDAAVLAGLGCIGRNNMLVTPACGPRIRLRALFLDADIQPAETAAFDPCADCRVNCRAVCPEHAMGMNVPAFEPHRDVLNLPSRDGLYDREACNVRMEKDISESADVSNGTPAPIKFCRKCEFVCPVGK